MLHCYVHTTESSSKCDKKEVNWNMDGKPAEAPHMDSEQDSGAGRNVLVSHKNLQLEHLLIFVNSENSIGTSRETIKASQSSHCRR